MLLRENFSNSKNPYHFFNAFHCPKKHFGFLPSFLSFFFKIYLFLCESQKCKDGTCPALTPQVGTKAGFGPGDHCRSCTWEELAEHLNHPSPRPAAKSWLGSGGEGQEAPHTWEAGTSGRGFIHFTALPASTDVLLNLIFPFHCKYKQLILKDFFLHIGVNFLIRG